MPQVLIRLSAWRRLAAGPPEKDALLRGEPPRCAEGPRARDRHPLVDHGEVERSRDLVPADALDLVRLSLAFLVGARVLAVDRPDGVACDHADLRVLLLQVAPHTRHGSAG